MSDVPSQWSEQRHVESFEVDMKGRLRPHMLFAYLLNSAWKHATLAAHGYQDLLERNRMWVLAKFQAAITELPTWGDRVLIQTWGKGTTKLYALRDFIVCSQAGSKLVSATSAWMILDKDRHRPLRFDSMNFPWNSGQSEMETNLEKVPELENGKAGSTFRAVYSDIDVNHHVTATKYLQWILDSHSFDDLQRTRLNYLEMSFLAEAALDEEVTVYSEQRDGRELCSVRRVSDQKELCRSRLEWHAE
jgi:acyl-ACP thioesterase